MSRLSLVIADLDRDYLSKLERFLVVNYPQRFDIYSFSSHGRLSEFLNNPDRKDILLINSILFKRELNLKNVEALILLKGDGLEIIPDGIDSINKYQHAEKLVTDILRLYAAKTRKDASMQGRSITRTICVHSPSGGTGKSSIAAGCSVLGARKGLKTFYLNLEDIPSTNTFFHAESTQNFSNVIYHLKGNEGNLGLKLEGAKCCDAETGVYFFPPPENVLEMGELSAEDVSRLITELKTSGLYDAVFIDMSAGMNLYNTAVLKISDCVVMVAADWDTAAAKMNAMKKGLEMFEGRNESELADKIIMVLNRCSKPGGYNGSKPALWGKTGFEIGEIAKKAGAGGYTDLVRNTAFLSGLKRLLEYVVPYPGDETATWPGGGFVG